MDYYFSGFGILNEFESLAFDTIPPVGVMSAESKSFSTKQFNFTETAYPNSRVVQMHNEDVNEVGSILLPAFQAALVNIVEKVSMFNDAAPADTQVESKCPEIINPTVEGSIIAGTHHIPGSIFGDLTIGSDTVHFRLWFSDNKFQQEYDKWEVKVIPPITDHDRLFGTFAQVKSLVDNQDYSEMITMIDQVTGDYPSTLNKVEKIDWIDPTNPNVRITLPWTIIGYGPNSRLRQNILKSIRDWLVSPESGSGKTIEEWIDLIPGLVNEDEFLFIPQWDKPAKVILGQPVPFYNPNIEIGKAQTILSTCIPDSEGNTLADKLELACITTHFPKSISGVMLGSPSNEAISKTFQIAFKDYSLFNTGNPSIGEVRPRTAAVYRALETLLEKAEVYKPTDILTGNLSVSSVGVVNKLSMDVEGTSTIVSVVTKESYLKLIPIK